MNVSLLHSCDTIFVLEKVSTLNPVSTKQANYIYIYIYIYIYTHTHLALLRYSSAKYYRRSF